MHGLVLVSGGGFVGGSLGVGGGWNYLRGDLPVIDPNEVAFVLIAGALLILIVMFVLLYIAYFRAEDIFRGFSGSPAVAVKEWHLGYGPVSRYLFIIFVGSMLVFQHQSLKRGWIGYRDYTLFSEGLKRLIRIPTCLMLVLGVIFYIVVGRYLGWIE